MEALFAACALPQRLRKLRWVLRRRSAQRERGPTRGDCKGLRVEAGINCALHATSEHSHRTRFRSAMWTPESRSLLNILSDLPPLCAMVVVEVTRLRRMSRAARPRHVHTWPPASALCVGHDDM